MDWENEDIEHYLLVDELKPKDERTDGREQEIRPQTHTYHYTHELSRKLWQNYSIIKS